MHHATAGDLDRRGQGDVPTMTLDEYLAHDWPMRLGYRLFRNPIVMFGLGWLWGLVIQPRLVTKDARPRLKRSTHITNLVLAVLVTGLCLLVGPGTFFLVQGPAAALAGATGVFLFYVQHQFEDTYWENNDDVELHGRRAARLVLPQAAAALPVLHRQHRPAPRPPPLGARPELQPAGRGRQRRACSTTCPC